MENRLMLEIVGYVASGLVAISLMMSSILRLRLINLAGATGFVVYGLLIRAYPVAVLNGLIVLVNLWYLARMLRAREYFQLLELQPDSDYLRHFLGYHDGEIRRLLPSFQYRPEDAQVALFILRDCNPAGVFIARREPNGVLRVALDFAIPQYRDLKTGRFLFVERADFFRERGIRQILVPPPCAPEFEAYLSKVGFERTAPQQWSFHIPEASTAAA